MSTPAGGTLGVDGPGALTDVRVLDLTDALGVYCTKLLADLGADVIKVEPPQGTPGRSRGPFYKDQPHSERSLWFLHFNANKRSVTLNPEVRDGQELFKRLAASAAVLVEDSTPGVMEARGLGYEDLRSINPGLVYTSVTPYGQSGPYSGYKGSDLTAQAMGGLMFRIGWSEDPPNSMGASFAYHHVATQAAVGTLLALLHRDNTGHGQQVDVSMHESTSFLQYDALSTYTQRGQLIRRAGPGQGSGGRRVRRIWNCREGHVRFQLVGSTAPGEWPRILDWLDEYGMVADLRDEKWRDFETRMNNLPYLEERVARFFETRIAWELMEEGQGRRIMIMAFNSVKDVLTDSHLVHENFFTQVDYPDLEDTLTYIGAPYRLSETPWRIRRPAPHLGEHNLEVYEEELDLSRDDLLLLKEIGAI